MWNLNFITRENLKQHIKNTISTYEKTLDGIDLSKFNSNIVDPIKMVFDSKVYRKDFEEVIKDELVRQRDKTNSNAIGYFHQNMFKYIKRCNNIVLKNVNIIIIVKMIFLKLNTLYTINKK